MPNIMDEFPTKYLGASDVEHHPTATIERIEREEVGQKKELKPIVFFEEFDKGVVLNKTNATNISKMYGYDTDNWIGKAVILGTAMVDFQGESKPAIRIWPPKRQAKPSANAPLKRQPAMAADEDAGQREFAPLPEDGDDLNF